MAKPTQGTEAAASFAKTSEADVRFFVFIIDVVLRADYVAHVARQALDGKEVDKDIDPTRLAGTQPGPGTKFLRSNRQPLLEMFLSRLVDNFQKYLVDLIREILRAKPQMLSTRQQSVTFEELLGYESIEDLVRDVIERKVNSLSYEGFADLRKWCTERGIEIEVPASRSADVIELIATRNIIIHNRCVVDERYVRTVEASKFALGATRDLAPDYLFGALGLLNNIVTKTDAGARKSSGFLRRSLFGTDEEARRGTQRSKRSPD